MLDMGVTWSFYALSAEWSDRHQDWSVTAVVATYYFASLAETKTTTFLARQVHWEKEREPR